MYLKFGSIIWSSYVCSEIGAILDSCPHHYYAYNFTTYPVGYFDPWNTIIANSNSNAWSQQQAFSAWYTGNTAATNLFQTPTPKVLDFSYCSGLYLNTYPPVPAASIAKANTGQYFGIACLLFMSCVAAFTFIWNRQHILGWVRGNNQIKTQAFGETELSTIWDPKQGFNTVVCAGYCG